MAGNRCGFNQHDYRGPSPLSGCGRMPKIISELQEQIRRVGVPTCRRPRAELDEAVRAVLITALEYVDIATLRLGIPTQNGWRPHCWSTIQTRLPWLSPARFFDAVSWLKKAGVLESSQRLVSGKKLKSNDTISGYAVTDKRVSEQLISAFGKTRRWRHEVKSKMQRVAAAAAKLSRTSADFYAAKSVRRKAGPAPIGNQGNSAVSPRAMQMILTARLLEQGRDDAAAVAKDLIERLGTAALAPTLLLSG